MTQSFRHKRVRPRGFTLIEVSLALVVFMMMTLMFAAVFPTAMRAGEMSNRHAQATLLTQHKLNELRQAGYAKLDYTDLYNLGFVDVMTSPPTTYPCILSFTQADGLVPNGSILGYFPSGTQGTITISNFESATTPTSSTLPVNTPALAGYNANVAAGNAKLVTISITWPILGAGAAAGQPTINGNAIGNYTTSTMIVSSH